jgi:hypothetical protein
MVPLDAGKPSRVMISCRKTDSYAQKANFKMEQQQSSLKYRAFQGAPIAHYLSKQEHPFAEEWVTTWKPCLTYDTWLDQQSNYCCLYATFIDMN